jgi:hypothetical protein
MSQEFASASNGSWATGESLVSTVRCWNGPGYRNPKNTHFKIVGYVFEGPDGLFRLIGISEERRIAEPSG